MDLQEDSAGLIHQINDLSMHCAFDASEVRLVLKYNRGNLSSRLLRFEHYFYILFINTRTNQKVSAKAKLCNSIQEWFELPKHEQSKKRGNLGVLADRGVKLFEQYQELLFTIGILSWSK